MDPYATEAADRALTAAYNIFGWTTAVSVIAIANPASARVAQRLGATIESRIEYRYGTADVHRHRPPHNQPATTQGRAASSPSNADDPK